MMLPGARGSRSTCLGYQFECFHGGAEILLGWVTARVTGQAISSVALKECISRCLRILCISYLRGHLYSLRQVTRARVTLMHPHCIAGA